MITVMMRYGGEMVIIQISGNSVMFGETTQGARLAPIECLHLDKRGVEKEFPDLIGKENWRTEAIDRFKKHLASMPSDKERARYIMDDLAKHGYQPYAIQESGRRVQKL